MAGTAALLRAPRRRHARRAPRGHLSRRLDRPRAGRAGARERAHRVLRRPGRGPGRWPLTVLATVAGRHRRLRERGVPRLHDACIFVYILSNCCLAFGGRVPYSRWSDAVLGFLRDICEPYLRDLPPGHPTVRPVRLQPDHRDHPAADRRRDPRGHHRAADGGRAWARTVAVAIAVIALDQVTKALVDANIARGGSEDVVARHPVRQRAQHGVAFSSLRRPVRSSGSSSPSRSWDCSCTSRVTLGSRWSGCPRACCWAGRSATSSTAIREGAVVDFIKVADFWPAFNVADISVTLGVLLLLWVMERGSAPARRA